MNNKSLASQLLHTLAEQTNHFAAATSQDIILANQLLHTLAEQDTEKRHADNDNLDTSTLPVVSNPEILAWLRSLAPLSEQELYDTGWKD